MPTLIERLTEVMQAKNWSRADLVRVSGASSSVVSQWLGHGSKLIYTIGQMEKADAIARESGYAALWIAKGLGPKFAEPAVSAAHSSPSTAAAIPVTLRAIAAASPTVRDELADALALFARTGASAYGLRITELLTAAEPRKGVALSRVDPDDGGLRAEVDPRKLEDVLGGMLEMAGQPRKKARAAGRKLTLELTAPRPPSSEPSPPSQPVPQPSATPRPSETSE